jgi:hypothetical protein
MPKFNGKPYGDKTMKEIYGLMEQYGVRGATSGTKRYYAGDNPIIEKQFDEYMKDLLQKVEIRGEFKDLATDQKYVLTKSREIAEYINKYLYHPLFGSMSIDIDSQKEQINQDKAKDDYGKFSEKFDEFINLLDDYGVPKKELILPTEQIGFDLDDRKNMLQEFVDKNPYPVFDRTKIYEDLQSKDSKIDNKHVKTNNISPTTELIDQTLNLTENGDNSGEAFIKSFNGHKKKILDFNIGGTLKHYHQNFRGLNGKLGNNQYNLPPGTGFQTSDEIKREYSSFWKPVFERNKLIKEFHNQMQNLEKYHQEMLQNKSTLESLDENNYTYQINNIITPKLKKFEPIHNKAYSNFKQIYEYSGDPNRPRNNPRTDEMKFIWKLFDNTNTKFHQLFDQKLKSDN